MMSAALRRRFFVQRFLHIQNVFYENLILKFKSLIVLGNTNFRGFLFVK
jgi:hypothetical protein